MTHGRVDPCPLCGAASVREVDAVAYADVWMSLTEVWGATVTPEVVAANQPSEVARLVACQGCGLEYFTPLAPGDDRFYSEVMATVPYEERRWEFGRTAERLGAGDRVVDFGCGSGAFLATVAGHVERAVGVDHNPDAAARAAARGLDVRVEPFDAFAEREAESFSVACGFQIVEHVASVDDLLRPMLACIDRPGRLFLSLPNRHRWRTGALEPLDCPPHHVSRWSADQVRALADRYSATLTDLAFEEPDFSVATLARRERVAAALRPLPAPARTLAARVVTRATLAHARHARLAARGRFGRRGVHGHTMLAEFRVT